MTHMNRETNTLYRNDDGFFSDATAAAGIAGWSRPDTGFGIAFADFNHDTNLDLFIANGGVAKPVSPRYPQQPYAQQDRFAVGLAAGRFPSAEIPLADQDSDPAVSRGLATGDIDGDGSIDVLVAVKDGPLRYYRNTTDVTGLHWLAIRPVSKTGATCELNAKVTLRTRPPQLRTVRPHASYLSSHENTVRFGLGRSDSPVDVVVTWPGGDRELFANLKVDQVHEVIHGQGQQADGSNLDESTRGFVDHSEEPTTGATAAVVHGGASTKSRNSKALRPIPPIRFAKTDTRTLRVELDGTALATWCRDAGLPAPPEPTALDAPTWKLVHPAIDQAARTPNVESLSSLAMYYDGHHLRTSAIPLYERVVKLAPKEAKWWHLLGSACFEEGMPPRAVEALTKATRLAPNSAASFGRLGEAHLANGNAEEARRVWKTYTTLRPKDAVGWVGLARAEEAAGNLPAAAEAAAAALALNPKNKPALVAAARIAARDGDEAMAQEYGQRATALPKDKSAIVDDFDLAMRSHAKSVGYLQQITTFLKANNRIPQAYAAAKLLTERRPDEPQNWQLLTWLATVLKQNDEALTYARIAVSIDPDFAPGWDTIALRSWQLKNFDQALEAANNALRADPEFTQAHICRGLALGSLERYEEAMVDLKQGLTSKPNSLPGLSMRAICELKTGQVDKATATLDYILKLSPNHGWAKKVRQQLP